MSSVYPYLIVYLVGFLTPFVILRAVLAGRTDDGSGCLLNFCITAVAALIFLIGYFWLLS